MHIIHAIQDLTPTAGTTVFCEAMRDCQAKAGHDVAIVVEEYYNSMAIRADIVHMHGVWNPFNVRVMRDCLAAKVPYVVSMHGCVMPRVFTKGRLKKLVFWHLFLKPLLKKAAAIHCTSEAEKEVCQNLGLPGPFVVAPLGVHLPQLVGREYPPSEASCVAGAMRGVPRPPQRTVLFLGRLGEEKGLVNLLDAWYQLQQEGVIHSTTTTNNYNYKLILAGPDWLGYKAELDAKIAAEHIEGVEFPGLVQGEAKDKLYREADIFVLPSPMENFSMVVLDALAYGIPAIATKGTPWSELESEHCGWWIDQGVEPLTNALREAISASTSDLHLLGQNGRALAERNYQWPVISDKLLTTYAERCI